MDEQHILWLLESTANYIYEVSHQEYADGVCTVMAIQLYAELREWA